MIGVCGDFLRWFISYICNISQAFATVMQRSDFSSITSGVPQGSHFGTLLFYAYIKGISTYFFHSNFLIYADDIKIFLTGASVPDVTLLQNFLDCLALYYENNALSLNIKKCHYILFTRNKNILNT